MIVDAELLQGELRAQNERDETLFNLAEAPRVTQAGRTLRKFSVNELQQLLNVLRGEMSLMGPPRPLLSEVARYRPEHFVRLNVLPGMTGLLQVRCRNGPSFADHFGSTSKFCAAPIGVVLAVQSISSCKGGRF